MERWDHIKDFEGIYMISTHGRVKRLAQNDVVRKNQYKEFYRNYEESAIVASNDTHGYPQVRLQWGGRVRVARVHRLVAETFLPNPDNLPQVHHKDHARDNPCLDNLMWVDNDTNQRFSYEETDRQWLKGTSHGMNKYTEQQVKDVYLLAISGEMSQTEIGEMFDMPQITVSNIKTKKTWREITDPLDIH